MGNRHTDACSDPASTKFESRAVSRTEADAADDQARGASATQLTAAPGSRAIKARRYDSRRLGLVETSGAPAQWPRCFNLCAQRVL